MSPITYDMGSVEHKCVHDQWYKTDRLWLAVLAAIMVAIGAAQAYRAGEQAGMQKSGAYQAGWDACQEQF